MTALRCLHCAAETTNGLVLCGLCQRFAHSVFDVLPVYFRNLARQRQPGRPNGSLGGGAGQWLMRRGDATGTQIAPALERAVNDLVTWARALTDDRDIELPDTDNEDEMVTAVCVLLDENLTSIATLEWAGQFLRDIAKHERVLRALTESAVPGWYAGACQRMAGVNDAGETIRCGANTHVVPGLTWVTCGGCGARTSASDHLEVVLAEARDWTERPMRLAEAIVALADTETDVSRLHKRISKWGERGQITAFRQLDADGDEVGPKRFRLGEVLDQLFAEREAHADTPATPRAS